MLLNELTFCHRLNERQRFHPRHLTRSAKHGIAATNRPSNPVDFPAQREYVPHVVIKLNFPAASASLQTCPNPAMKASKERVFS